jgi:hypothetical protein
MAPRVLRQPVWCNRDVATVEVVVDVIRRVQRQAASIRELMGVACAPS